MHGAELSWPADFAGWREAARRLVMAGVAPEAVAWRVAGEPAALLGGPPPPEPAEGAPPPRVPRAFPELAETVVQHRDPERFTLLHRLLARLQGERALLEVATDPDVRRAEAMSKAVRRDAHKMRAFVRFREVPLPDEPGDGRRFVAWFEPEHHILEAEAPFFLRRFAAMRWSILTPRAAAHWDGEALRFGPGALRADAPPVDAAEDLWRAYFASVFNPARLKPDAMRAEMPKRYWRNLPEARDIPRLIAEAPGRVAAMVARGATAPAARRQRAPHLASAAREGDPRGAAPDGAGSAGTGPTGAGANEEEGAGPPPAGIAPAAPSPLHPAAPSRVGSLAMSDSIQTTAPEHTAALDALKRDLATRDDLPPWAANSTQVVFGEGPVGATLMFVGEQPGDEEDLRGRPFVGPAGRLFNRAMTEAGVTRDEAYVTNAVKHFKFTPTGKRRLHQTPDASDITYYQPFLRQEIALVAPRLLVTLGATALRAVTGRAMPVTKVRSSLLRGADGRLFFPTVHPSYLLRIPDEAGKAREYEKFVEDLAKAAATARTLPAAV